MTGFNSKRDAAADKLDNDDLTIAYMSGYHAGKRAAQPAQEPAFGWIKQSELAQARLYGGSVNLWLEKHDCDFPVYVAPPQREPLTDEAVLDIANKYLYNGGKNYGILEFARAIESAHGITEKNA